MKNNREFKESVFAKAEAYKKTKKLSRAKKIKTAVALLTCMAILIPAVYIPISVAMGNLSTAATSVATTQYVTNAGATFATGQTTEAISVTTTTIAADTTTYATHTTTTHAFTWASTTTACGPDTIKEGSFFNGANHVMTEYDAKYGEGFRTEVEYYLTDDTAPYFSESFFAENAVIIVRFNASVGSKPCFLRMHKEISGALRIDIGFPTAESDSDEATWLIMIPVSLEALQDVTEIEVYGNDLFVSE